MIFSHGIKTGLLLPLIALLLIASAPLNADEVQFTALTKTTVRVGENFQLQYKINAEGTNFQGPQIVDFQVLNGPSTSTSSSVQIINGQVTRDVSYVFTYVLRGIKEGEFTIQPARILVGGKEFFSNSVKIKVTKDAGSPGTQGSSGSQGSSGTTVQGTENDLFLRAYISNSTPVQGEQVIITYKIFTTIPISNIDASKMSSFSGFWSKDLLANREDFPQTREYINGKEYVVAEVKKYALFPQRSGEITIEPGELKCVAQVKTTAQRRSSDPFFDSFFNDPFFNSRFQNVEKQLLSNSLKLNVQPVPSKNKPDGYGGAVGNFTFSSHIDKTEVKTNEAINLKFTLNGTGNVELIDAPKVVFPTDFEVYDPEISNNVKVSMSGVSGTRTFDYLIIPRNPGTYTIKPVVFSYFDLNKRDYVTITTPEYKITVQRGEGSSANITYSGVSQEDIKYIGKDIRHIKLPPFQLKPIGSFFFRSGTYYLLLLFPIILFATLVFLWRKQVKQRSNTAMLRTKKATRVSLKRLKVANIYLKEGKETEFYVEISKALWGYISDKFSVPRSELSMDNVKERLLKKSLNEETITDLINTLNNTEFARFAPGNKSENMDKIYQEALTIISKIERELR
jgi:hypothetical protein